MGSGMCPTWLSRGLCQSVRVPLLDRRCICSQPLKKLPIFFFSLLPLVSPLLSALQDLIPSFFYNPVFLWCLVSFEIPPSFIYPDSTHVCQNVENKIYLVHIHFSFVCHIFMPIMGGKKPNWCHLQVLFMILELSKTLKFAGVT